MNLRTMGAHRSVVLATMLLVAAVSRAEGQTVPAACDAVSCALQFDPSFWGSDKLRRGPSGTEVVSFGDFFAPDLAPVFAAVPSSVALAEQYESRHDTGGVIKLVGGIALAIGAIAEFGNLVPSMDMSESNWGDPWFYGGAAAAVAGELTALSGRSSLREAIRVYNAGLPDPR